MYMKTLILSIVLTVACAAPAHADIWKWVDANGQVHLVDSKNPIYMWTDEEGRVHYSDTPGHEDAVSVELIWVSPGVLEDRQDKGDASVPSGSDGFAYPGETPAERAERKKAEAYYCKRATEVYDSYIKAPKLYETSADGERKYLSKQDAEVLIAETHARVDEYCK